MLGLALPFIARRRIGAAAPPPAPPPAWTPAQLAGQLAGWWDADDASTVTLATGVSQWSDKSGNARHFLQPAPALQPGYGLAALNARAGIAFNQKYLVQTAAAPPLATTLMLVLVASNDAAATNNRGILSVFPAGATADYASPAALVAMEQMASGAYQTYANGVTGPSSGAGVAGIAGKILAVEKDSGNIPYFRTNGALSPTAGPAFTGNNLATATMLLLGGRNVGGINVAAYGYVGTIHEIVLANAFLGQSDRQKLEGYLASRWGLRALLPTAHPFKSATP